MTRKQAKKGGGIKLAAAAGVAAAFMGGTKPGHSIATDLASIGGAGQYTPASWAHALLKGGGFPRSACNMAAVEAWESAEGGHWHNSAEYNPLDTTQAEPGSWSMNSAGVQAYPSWRKGLRATLATLGNGSYGAVTSALQAGNSDQAVESAVASSVWGTGGFAVPPC
jgi:hypothetical protein